MLELPQTQYGKTEIEPTEVIAEGICVAGAQSAWLTGGCELVLPDLDLSIVIE